MAVIATTSIGSLIMNTILPIEVYQPKKPSNRKRAAVLLVLVFFMLILSSCSATATDIPPEICTAYQDALFTLQLIGGVGIVVGLAMLAFKKAISSFLPSQGAQTGAVASAIGVGVLLLTFSTSWGTQVLTIFGIPDLYALCGL